MVFQFGTTSLNGLPKRDCRLPSSTRMFVSVRMFEKSLKQGDHRVIRIARINLLLELLHPLVRRMQGAFAVAVKMMWLPHSMWCWLKLPRARAR